MTDTSAIFKDIKVLIVDDNPKQRALTKRMLNHSGFSQVEDTADQVIAMKKIQMGMFDLVLLDWWMPNIQGIDILKQVRSYNKELPVLMLTSEKDQEKVVEAIRSGANDYVLKPFTRKTLISKLEEALKK